MIGATVRIEDHTVRLQQAVSKAAFKNAAHAAASIRKTEIESIKFGKGPSAPGTPPHTHGREFTKKGKKRKGVLQRAIAFWADRETGEAVIGPRFKIAGTSGSAHEFGGRYKGQTYPERPFAAPALEQNLSRFAGSWKGSIGA